jgi:hypothetical protein
MPPHAPIVAGGVAAGKPQFVKNSPVRGICGSPGGVRGLEPQSLEAGCHANQENAMSIPTTYDRVPEHTAEHVNQRIERQTLESVRKHAANPAAIAGRLRELDEEWDIERAIELNASALAFAGVALGFLHHRYWLALPAAVTAFLFQHAVQGWCPPVPVLRRYGFRTSYEIERERYALKAIRGDFERVNGGADKVSAAMQAVR